MQGRRQSLTYSNCSLGHKYLKIIEWADTIAVIRVVVVQVAVAIRVKHIIRVTSIGRQ